MSYSIVFETKIAILSDGRLIHFSRTGCNNDSEGRLASDFRAEILTVKEMLGRINGYKSMRLPFKVCGIFEMKLLGKPATMYDYAMHLERMLKRALSYQDFFQTYRLYIDLITGIEVTSPVHLELSLEEYSERFRELIDEHGTLSVRRRRELIDDSDEKRVVELIESGAPLEITIKGKR